MMTSLPTNEHNLPLLKPYDAFDFERIAYYYQLGKEDNTVQRLSDQTWNDLDMDDVFRIVDHTQSKPGQQWLYAQLRTIHFDDPIPSTEPLIRYLKENPALESKGKKYLRLLDEPGAYFLTRLFEPSGLKKPKWHKMIPILSALSIASLVGFVFFPPLFYLFILVQVINFIIHFWNKRNILIQANMIAQLMVLYTVSRKLIEYHILNDPDIQKSNQVLRKISSHAQWISPFKQINSELSQVMTYLLDLIKASLLIEPLLIYLLEARIQSKKQELQHLWKSVAILDAACSILQFKRGLSHHCIPTFSETPKQYRATGLYHPLIPQAVTNDLSLSDNHSVLITGSNMSGKTTFIRTIGINVILAQTLHLACARSFTLPRTTVDSAIRITDDLAAQSSYYLEEVKTIRGMIQPPHNRPRLILLDELFKGTNTIDRIAISKTTLEYLNDQQTLVFAATHDLELLEYLRESYHYFYFTESIRQGQIHFDYRLKQGALTHSNAIEILRLYDFPPSVITKAQTLANQLRSV